MRAHVRLWACVPSGPFLVAARLSPRFLSVRLFARRFAVRSARYVGNYKTTAMQVGYGSAEAPAIKPAHGLKGALNSFKDFTHLGKY